MHFNSNVSKSIKTLKIPVLNIPIAPMPHTIDDGTEVAVAKTEREIWKESIKINIKDERKISYQLKKMYSDIWVQVSDELWATAKSIGGSSAAADKFDAVGLIKLIHKSMFNVQSRQYFPAAFHMIKRSFYYRVQEKGLIVQEYYENF